MFLTLSLLEFGALQDRKVDPGLTRTLGSTGDSVSGPARSLTDPRAPARRSVNETRGRREPEWKIHTGPESSSTLRFESKEAPGDWGLGVGRTVATSTRSRV